MRRGSVLPASSKQTGPDPSFPGLEFWRAGSIRCSGASIWEPQIRTRRTRQECRSAMINAPVFAVSTPEAFYEMLRAHGSKDPNATAAFAAAHPEFGAFGDWAKNGPWTASYAEERFNSLNSFVFVDASGAEHAVRWSLLPAARPGAVSPDELAKRGPDFLEQDIARRVAHAPQLWPMLVTVPGRGDPTADPTKPWPDDRRTIEVGTLAAQQV